MQTANNFCNRCGGDSDETGVWMHDSKIRKAAMINTLEQNMKELEERINEKINKPLTSKNNFCNCCGGDFDKTGIWMHDNKPVCFNCWCNLNKLEPDDILNDTRINISNISEEDWNDLSEEYRDELSIMDSVDKYVLDFMLSVSRRTK